MQLNRTSPLLSVLALAMILTFTVGNLEASEQGQIRFDKRMAFLNVNDRDDDGDDPRDTPPPEVHGEEIDPETCGHPEPVSRLSRRGKAYTRIGRVRRPGQVQPGVILPLPPAVAHRKQVKFTARMKNRDLAKKFTWVQYVRGYIWSGHYQGGQYQGVNNRGRIVGGQRITSFSIPPIAAGAAAPLDSEWTMDDLRQVGHYTTHRTNNKVFMRDKPGLDNVGIRPDGRTFLEANFEFRSYLVCPLAPKIAYARCIWSTDLSVESFTITRNADKPSCEILWPPIDLLHAGDPALDGIENVQRTQGFFALPNNWALHEEE